MIADVPGTPQKFEVSNVTSSTISLSWFPPFISETLGLSIFNYIINCSTDHSLQNNVILQTDSLNATVLNLHAFASYNCCVAVNSTHGIGQLACQNSIKSEKIHTH